MNYNTIIKKSTIVTLNLINNIITKYFPKEIYKHTQFSYRSI